MDEWLTVITLDRTPDRFDQFCEWNSCFKIRRFAAVDGEKVNRNECLRNDLITARNEYVPGALGAALSHIALWRSCAQGTEAFHIVEDDIVLRRDFWSVAKPLLASMLEWDIVLWSHNLDWPVVVGPILGGESAVIQYGAKDTVTKLQAFRATATPSIMLPLLSGAGIGCYSVSPRGAANLLSACLPLANFKARFAAEGQRGWNNTGLDVEMSRHYGKLGSFIAFPPLAVAPNELSKSTIRGHLTAPR